MSTDLLVCGLGPAGRALAHRALAHGRTVTVVDPAPDRPWTATYAAWADELPGWLAPEAVTARVPEPTAWGTRPHRLAREYVVLDTPELWKLLGVDGAAVVADRVVELAESGVTVASGATLTADRVIDARGIARSAARAEQTAYGVFLDADRSADLDPLFMDWRADHGAALGATPSFLYAVPVGGGRMLLEETCLAGRPALDSRELRERLHRRLRSRGIALTGSEPVERVRFPVQGGRPGSHAFGAAGGFLHPATGYSVGAALSAADAVIEGRDVWPLSARAVHRLRTAGLRALLALPPADLPLFFDAFFALAPDRQRAYLSGRADLPGTAGAMLALAAALPWRLRRHLAAATFGTPIAS